MVDIGYLEKVADWKLESRFFPCKMGGKPAWLDLANIPSLNDLQCSKCLQPCIFLCQIYAPIDDDSFHRSIFVFLCLDPDCCELGNGEQSFKVFRCQLPRENSFYPYDPPGEDASWHPEINVDQYHTMCVYCGCKGGLRCAKCKMVTYCSKEHQVLDWKGGHKTDCKSGTRSNNCRLLPEFEILIEPESVVDEPKEQSEGEKLKDYEKLVREGGLGTLHADSSATEDLIQMAVSKEDKQFRKFCSRIQTTPDQVLRYERGGSPLWVSEKEIPETIPECQYCGGPRRFEFQLLPQALNHLNFDNVTKSIDWGTLAVFTCTNSCDGNPQYKSEYLWKQDISSEN